MRQSTSLLAEPERIVHVGDRESDIYELFSIAHQAGTHFLLSHSPALPTRRGMKRVLLLA